MKGLKIKVFHTMGIMLLFSACVTLKKYNSKVIDLSKKIQNRDSVNSELSSKTDFLLKHVDNLNNELQVLRIQIKNMSQLTIDTIMAFENTIPIIPLPPPQPSSYYKFNRKVFVKAQTYGNIDSILYLKLSKAKWNKLFYFALRDEGFAIATPIEEIDKNGMKISDEINDPSELSEFFKYFFSRQHLNDLFFSKKGYYRCIIIIVSPNIYSLGGRQLSYENLSSWIKASYISLPPRIANSKITLETEMVALLYEFEQNENLNSKVQILDDSRCRTKLESNIIIKAIINED